MRAEKKEARMRQIEAAAYDLLAEVGYDGCSMLAVAKRARASNETMYRWYGDKNGLFASMVRANARQVSDALQDLAQSGAPPLKTLHRLAPILLGMLLGDGAIALNRAAAADASGALGREISDGGRASILPLIQNVLRRAVDDGVLVPPETGEMGPLFINLLVGDQQIRRVIGVLDAPSASDIDGQAQRAMAQFMALCQPA